MRNLSLITCIFLMAWAIVSCQKDADSVVQVTVTQDRVLPSAASEMSPAPTFALTSTHTPSPLATAAVQPTFAPKSALMPTFTAVPTLPSATPKTQPAAYQLKEWTEQDALNLVSEARSQVDHFVWDDDVHYSTNHVRFEALHWSLDVAANEAAMRFPNSGEYEELTWTTLYAKAWRGGSDNVVDARIVAFLQDRLDGGFYDPAVWGERIEFYDFVILHVADVENLFGDGRITPIYKIETIISDGQDGLYFALEADNENFQILPILGYWPASHGYWVEEPTVGDHTDDGLPEIAVMPRGHSGSICYSNLYIMQWDGSQFVNLAAQPDGSTIGFAVCGNTWDFLPAEENGSQSIQTTELFFDRNYATPMHRIFVLDQTGYTLIETIIQPVLDDNPIGWINYNIGVGEWETAAQAIDDLLNQWDTSPPPNIDPSYPDFLRFQQGWLYAVNAQPENGRAAFQQLIDEPVNPITPTLSLAAQAFLDVYQTDSDVYQACAAAERVMLDAFLEPSSFSSDYLAAWGYLDDDLPCDSMKAWQILLEQTNVMEPEEAITFLNAHGVSMVDMASNDLDGDGNDEILFTIESNDLYGESWRTTHAMFLTEFDLQYVPLGFDTASVTKWETVLTQGDKLPLHFVQVDETLRIFQLNIQEEEITIQPYFRSVPLYNVENFALVEKDNGLGVTINYLPTTFRPRRLSLRWDPIIEDFEIVGTDVPYFSGRSAYDLLAQAKVLLFEEEKFEETAVMLAYFTANYEVELPEIFYLLALTYELLGQKQQAVQTYWSLWYDFPEDSFAIMARRKLVSAEP